MLWQPTFESLPDLFASLADIFNPPERLTVAEAAERYRFLNNPGAYIGPYRCDMAPELIEPMNVLASHRYKACVFVGPAQSSKTESLLLNWAAYTVKVSPMDLILFCPTMGAAKDFSIRRVDRMNRDSKAIGQELLPDRDADNLYDKRFKSGILLSISWPSVTNFAGRPIPRVALTDYDRMDDDIEGDGSPFDLASKRTTTFGSFAMTLAESSPSRPVENPKWLASSPHEAPPAKGIIALYNRGDRRLRYWPCPHCGEFFEGTFRRLRWEERANASEAAATVTMVCPSCNKDIKPDHRTAMRRRGVWLAEGQTVTPDGVVHGEPPPGDIASFWLKGPSAAFQDWRNLVKTYLDALAEFEKTGSEEALKKFWNTDAGEPYIPKAAELERLPEVLKGRAVDRAERHVPADVRFLIATADVQKNLFVVQVFGIKPGAPCDIEIIDRFQIRKSKRKDQDGDTEWCKPGTYLEDWELLEEEVLDRKYPLADGSGRFMQVKAVGCDSGGRAGVTTNAYAFWRRLKADGKAGRFHLVKGEPQARAPRAQIRHPDSNDRGLKAVARGDVPVLFLNSNLLKDELANRLDCIEPGHGQVIIPKWLDDDVFAELCAEVRTPHGWQAPHRRRNEAWDLSYYCLGLLASPYIQIERIDWAKPPGWAAPWAENDLVTKDAATDRFAVKESAEYDFAELGRKLG